MDASRLMSHCGIQAEKDLQEGIFQPGERERERAASQPGQESLVSGVVQGGQLEATRRVGSEPRSVVVVVVVRCRSTFEIHQWASRALVLFK